ncbi:DNA-binding protein [Candidatus Methylobacter oryzae]|uniref:KfrA N-terminal DNA-binding domain-containing protein n=1 Tax=Candidatus Methylobacter oryzae TaxID=2497749 RepID=A0ABY3CDV4_9GAMM|nr:DNA-binding protein [Candidatus Methylobacter oryzae]TRW98991.1 hypothetical protein EKO24_006845 [Candidatus Methylobacter oryzae]
MNNISQISKAKRLTEEEVHEAAEALQENGVKVSSIEVYKFLGRGSLTTITNFLKTWKQENTDVNTLPALIALPEALKKSTEQLLIKLWAESQELAEKEINSQREALRQAEAAALEKITEAQAFSDEQSRQIERLEAEIEQLKEDHEQTFQSWKAEIKKEQDWRQEAVVAENVSKSKLLDAEKRLDYVNLALLEQQKANKALTAENAALKAKLEASEKQLEKYKNELFKAEDRIIVLKEENRKDEVKIEVQENQINQLVTELKNQEEKTLEAANENKTLREKAAKLEGELIAWKDIKPEAKKNNLPAKKANKQNESCEVKQQFPESKQ